MLSARLCGNRQFLKVKTLNIRASEANFLTQTYKNNLVTRTTS